MPRIRDPALAAAGTEPRLSIRLDLGRVRIGPGKVALLEEIGRSGSISAAGRALRMSYRRAWVLVEDLNNGFGTPVVETLTGGSGGGGARLTVAGEAVIRRYRAIEVTSKTAANTQLAELAGLLARPGPAKGVAPLESFEGGAKDIDGPSPLAASLKNSEVTSSGPECGGYPDRDG